MKDRREPRDQLPDWVAGRLSGAEAEEMARAVEADPDLAREAEALAGLLAARPRMPEAAVRAMRDRAQAEFGLASAPARRRWRVPLWQWSAAALVVVAAGTAVVWERTGRSPDLGERGLDEVATAWILDESVVAGEAGLEGLTEADLNTLLAELER